MSVSSLNNYKMSFQMRLILAVAIALGALSFYLLMNRDMQRAWFMLLIGCTMFLGMGLYGLFFTAIQHVTSAKWSTPLRRIFETMSMTLPVSALLFVIIYKGAHHLYEWSHADKIAHDELLQWKSPFLNEHGFQIRLIVYFFIWIAASLSMNRKSFRQDESGDVNLTFKNKSRGALILVLYGLSVCMAGFDIIMSIEPHWFSTIFGVYFFAGLFQAGLAMTILIAWVLYCGGVLKDFITKDHFHDLGRFLFGFSIFWAYIAFSQFMLIWYGNLPEETFIYRDRMNHGWEWVSLALLLIRWTIPFLVLMPYAAKRSFKVILPISVLVIFGQWLDLYWFVTPALRLHKGVESIAPTIGWHDLLIGVGFMAFFVLVLGLIMERVRMVPIKDPRLEAGVHYYHHG